MTITEFKKLKVLIDKTIEEAKRENVIAGKEFTEQDIINIKRVFVEGAGFFLKEYLRIEEELIT